MNPIFGLFWPWRKPRRPQLAWSLVGLGLLGAPAIGYAQATDGLTAQVEKRYFLARVDDRCHLLSAPAAVALKAGYVQARNAAIRSGRDMSVLAPALDQAEAAAANADCHAPQIMADLGTAQNALRTFVVQMRLDLPGSRAKWTAFRADQDETKWRLVQYQSTADGDFAFGLHGTLGQNRLSVMAHFADGARPYAARILARDTDAVATGIINPSPYAVATRMPLGFGEMSSLSFMAYDASDVRSTLRLEGVRVNFAGFNLGGDYVGAPKVLSAQRFDFPKTAIMAMAKLDPREDVVIAFDCPDGTRYARFEVGDFIPGVAYVSLPSPYTHGS